ncbi:MAG: phosphatase PAP2 family protein [Planctomycetes bacterium]|nr:phosphatase PAP2 family protein [Planctomycetota bacterium]
MFDFSRDFLVLDRKRRLGRGASAAALAATIALSACSGGGGGGSSTSTQQTDATATLKHWNRIAMDATGLDHTPVAPGETRTFGEQFGPCRAARAEAIVHIAIFDAVNAIRGGFQSFTGIAAAPPTSSLRAAIATAAHDTLVAEFPSQSPNFDALLSGDLATVQDVQAKTDGIAAGRAAAAAILALRVNDGSEHPEPRFDNGTYTAAPDPGVWRMDPVSQIPLVLGGDWAACAPFVLTSASQFRLPPPPALDSTEYTLAYEEVKSLGGDGVATATVRDEERTRIGVFWAYDGTPSLCAPPRLYNQIVVQIAEEQGTNDVSQLARLLALVNVSMADAGIGLWESKYFYKYWRPVAGIRESDPGTGPSGLGDGNPVTAGDPNWSPLGAPKSNTTGSVNFTPPFPAYPSGHAGFGGAIFQTLRRFYGTDEIAFTFVSDEFNGVTRDYQGNVRPLIPRTFRTLSEAEEENGQSRIYLGIHWTFDKTGGITLGRNVADWVFTHRFAPAP